MKILSAVTWRQRLAEPAGRTGLLLQQAESGRGPLLLALVAVGGGEGGELASAYLAGQVRQWFSEQHLAIIVRRKSLGEVRGQLRVLLRGVSDELALFNQKKQGDASCDYALLLAWQGKYVILQRGDVESRYFNGRRCRAAATRPRQIRRHSSLLLDGGSFSKSLGDARLATALDPSQFGSERQITKRLAEMADFCIASDDKEQAAIYIKFK